MYIYVGMPEYKWPERAIQMLKRFRSQSNQRTPF